MSIAAPEPNVKPPRQRRQPRCKDCYFMQNLLCALKLDEPCPTFRPAHPDGLRPPQQLTFMFRAKRAADQWPAPSTDGGGEAALADMQPDVWAAAGG
jgi:hypothetical protein